MIEIEIQFPSGRSETRRLSKSQPLSIGRHKSNDIVIDDDGVGMMHGRISWNRKQYEIAAAGLDGIDVNGKLVRTAAIAPGDVIRIGSVDLIVGGSTKAKSAQGGQSAPAPMKLPPDEDDDEVYSLKPPDENDAPLPSLKSPKSPRSSQGPKSARQEDGPDWDGEWDPLADSFSDEPLDLAADDSGSSPEARVEILDAESDEEDRAMSAPDVDQLPPESYDSLFADEDADEEFDHSLERPSYSPPSAPPLRTREDRTAADPQARERRKAAPSRTAADPARRSADDPSTDRLRARLRSRSTRPGEQDILTSPLVLGLGGGAMVLLLLAGIFYFIIVRETVQRDFDAAREEMNQGKYAQAIVSWENFLERYPYHEYAQEARYALGQSRIEREISGSAAEWGRGLQQLNEFIDQYRDDPRFRDQHGQVRDFAQRIALGAAQTAQQTKQRDLLAVSAEAAKILDRFSPSDAPPAPTQKQIQDELKTAEAAVLKQEVLDKSLAAMNQALAQDDPLKALRARQDLLQRYPELINHRDLTSALQKTLQAERQLVAVDEQPREALTEEWPAAFGEPLTLMLHARAQSDEASVGRIVFTVAKGCCYAVDSVTGEAVWKRVIGMDPPFFPTPMTTSRPAVLVFDANSLDLLLLDRADGSLMWRQPIGEPISGPPLVKDAQIFLPTRGGSLLRISLETGRLAERLQFPQQLLAPPVPASDEEHLVIAGDEGVLYTVSTHPLECRQVSNLDHRAGSVSAPLMAMGRLILMIENDRSDSCLLHALELGEGGSLQQVAEARLQGHVRDAPILRGRQLVVPSSGERIVALTVSDDANQQTLTRIAAHQVETETPGPIHLSAGPDGQLWMSGSALRKFQVTADSITPEPNPIGGGISAQPLETIGRDLYVGRRFLFCDAVAFSRVDRETMAPRWKTIAGAGILAWTSSMNGALIAVTESGGLFYVSGNDLAGRGFKQRADLELELDERLREPLRARQLDDGRLAVSCGGSKPRLWLINRQGRIDQQIDLDQPLDAPPVVLAGGLILPLPGRLRMHGSAANQVEDYLLPIQQDAAVQWQAVQALDDQQLIVLDSTGRIARLQLRRDPVPHLAEAVSLDLDAPVDHGITVRDGSILLADSHGRLQWLAAADMQTISEAALDAVPSNAPWRVGDCVYVETAQTHLHCFEADEELRPAWTLPLEGAGLAGPPLLLGEQLLLAKRDGELIIVEADAGKVLRRERVPQPLSHAAFEVDSRILVPSIDGSLYDVGAIQEVDQ